MNGPTGPAIAEFPTASETLLLFVKALSVSVPAETLVLSVTVWLAGPEPPSVAVHVTD